jgi:hypothetical protein
MKFELGRCVITRNAKILLDDLDANPLHYLMRHHSGDWGALDGEDAHANDVAVLDGTRILSRYPIGVSGAIYIITEADRSSTCIMLTSDY